MRAASVRRGRLQDADGDRPRRHSFKRRQIMRVIWIIMNLEAGKPEPGDYASERDAKLAILKLADAQSRPVSDWRAHRIQFEE